MPTYIMIDKPEDFYESTQSHKLGKLFEDEFGNLYRYCKNGSATAAAKGGPAHATAVRGVYKKEANKIALLDLGLGVPGAWTAAVPAGKFGFVLADGIADYLLGDTGTAAGEPISSVGGNIWATATVGTHVVSGIAHTDDTASVFTGEIHCL